MSGVVDDNGQQWEHCTQCGKWVRFQNLWYEEPTPKHPHGRDLCKHCAAASHREAALA